MPNGEESKLLAWNTAKELLENNHFVTLRDTEEIFRYEDGIYTPDGQAYIKQKMQENFETKEEINSHLVHEVIGHVQRSTLKDRTIFEENNPHLVLENCLFNVDTFQKEDFTPDYYALAKMPVKFEPERDYHNSLFWTFINEILDPKDVIGVQEELGAILRKKYLTKKFSIYYGETDTGKSTLLNVIQALIGQKNISNLSLQQIASQERFYLASLFGKMLNCRDDMPKDIIRSAGPLKEVTGRSRITGEKKFQNPFEFVNHAYILVSCNELPPFSEDDLAVFNRIKLRAFKKRYGGHTEPDRELEEKLTQPDELSAILNWGLEGLDRLRQNGWNFSNGENEIVIRELYKRKSDPLWGFCEDCIEETGEDQDIIEKEELYNSFKAYCKSKELSDQGKDYFYKHIHDKVTVKSGQPLINGKRPHCFIGIKLKSNINGKSPVHGVPSENMEQGEQGQAHLTATLTDIFTKLDSDKIEFAQCEFCGENRELAFWNQDRRYACRQCANGE